MEAQRDFINWAQITIIDSRQEHEVCCGLLCTSMYSIFCFTWYSR